MSITGNNVIKERLNGCDYTTVKIGKDAKSAFYVTDKVVPGMTIMDANKSEEHRINWITGIAAISRGKDASNNPKLRYEKLLKEAALGTPSRAFEFLPVVLRARLMGKYFRLELLNDDYKIDKNISVVNFMKHIARFSFIEGELTTDENVIKDMIVHTNMRCLLNAGVKYEYIPYDVDGYNSAEFGVVKAQIPMFVWSQFPMTHTQLSKISVSDRVTDGADDMWVPDDLCDRIRDKLSIDNRTCCLEIKKILSEDYSQTEVKELFKELGYPKEIYNRAVYYFKYKSVIIGGWMRDPYCWEHALIERNAVPEKWSNWTQKETAEFATACKKILFPGYPDGPSL